MKSIRKCQGSDEIDDNGFLLNSFDTGIIQFERIKLLCMILLAVIRYHYVPQCNDCRENVDKQIIIYSVSSFNCFAIFPIQ